MKEIVKTLWRLKIQVMFYFNLGFGELSNLVNLVKNVVIVLAGLVWLFKIDFPPLVVILICIVSFLLCIGLGVILKVTGMADYATKVGNEINPELKLVRRIANHFGINEDE